MLEKKGKMIFTWPALKHAQNTQKRGGSLAKNSDKNL